MPFFAQHIRAAQVHLKRGDPVMRDIIRAVGPFTLKTQKPGFQLLAQSILSQQISTAAARTILTRVDQHLSNRPWLAQEWLQVSAEDWRGLGVSRQKARYCRDLAEKVVEGSVQLENLSRRSDSEIIENLTQVLGVGVWTAQMFLIFGLGRLDVLPGDDLGIRNAVQKRYGWSKLPTAREIETVARPWRPFASVASWYLWRSLELPES